VSAVIDLVGVVKEYPGTPPVRALDGVDLRVERGEFVAIVGPSGSGKSTLLNLLGALDRPTSGSVSVDGTEISSLSDRELSALRGRRIGFVFQTFNLIDGLDAIDNVALGLVYDGIPRKVRHARAQAALERVGLAHRATHSPSRLSGGECQRVAIARAIVTEPALLLADEPTGNLDTRTGETIIDTFAELHRDGATIMLITHDQSIAARLPRRVVMRDGRILESADTSA
jgi:putative ABC transport system ATP-binding protein